MLPFIQSQPLALACECLPSYDLESGSGWMVPAIASGSLSLYLLVNWHLPQWEINNQYTTSPLMTSLLSCQNSKVPLPASSVQQMFVASVLTAFSRSKRDGMVEQRVLESQDVKGAIVWTRHIWLWFAAPWLWWSWFPTIHRFQPPVSASYTALQELVEKSTLINLLMFLTPC